MGARGMAFGYYCRCGAKVRNYCVVPWSAERRQARRFWKLHDRCYPESRGYKRSSGQNMRPF